MIDIHVCARCGAEFKSPADLIDHLDRVDAIQARNGAR